MKIEKLDYKIDYPSTEASLDKLNELINAFNEVIPYLTDQFQDLYKRTMDLEDKNESNDASSDLMDKEINNAQKFEPGRVGQELDIETMRWVDPVKKEEKSHGIYDLKKLVQIMEEANEQLISEVQKKWKEEKQPEAPHIDDLCMCCMSKKEDCWCKKLEEEKKKFPGKLEIKQTEILPCPWCASPAMVEGYAHASWKIMCSNMKWDCPVIPISLESDTQQEAIDAWNRRG